jgi:hypothetical protein
MNTEPQLLCRHARVCVCMYVCVRTFARGRGCVCVVQVPNLIYTQATITEILFSDT